MHRHGTDSITIEGLMLIAKVSGYHNEADAQAVTASLAKAAATFAGVCYAQLVDARDLQGITPEGFAVINDYHQQEVSQGLVALAFVATNQVLPSIFENYVAIDESSNMQIFGDVDEATEWLQSKLNSHS